VATTGHTPAHAVELLRIEAACQLLKTTSEPIKRIAETAGLVNVLVGNGNRC